MEREDEDGVNTILVFTYVEKQTSTVSKVLNKHTYLSMRKGKKMKNTKISKFQFATNHKNLKNLKTQRIKRNE